MRDRLTGSGPAAAGRGDDSRGRVPPAPATAPSLPRPRSLPLESRPAIAPGRAPRSRGLVGGRCQPEPRTCVDGPGRSVAAAALVAPAAVAVVAPPILIVEDGVQSSISERRKTFMLYYADSLLRRFEMPKFHLSPAPEPLRLRLTAKTIAVAAATTAATAAMFSDGSTGIVNKAAQLC